MTGPHWTEEELKILRENYPNAVKNVPKEDLLKLLPGRNWDNITQKASKLKLRKVKYHHVNGDVSKLLEETPEAYYWAGFIAADGSIRDNIGLSLSVCAKDKEHILKFAKFINTTNITSFTHKMGGRFGVGSQTWVTIQDIYMVPQFALKFDLKQKKTYNPPIDLSWMKDDLFLSFFAGFIDGDGCISYNKKCNGASLDIHVNYTWKDILVYMEKHVYETCKIESYKPLPRIALIPPSLPNGQPLAQLRIRNTHLLHEFKRRLLSLNVPMMERKWDKIDLSKPSQFEISTKKRENILLLQKQNISSTEIAKRLGITVKNVRQLWEPNLYQYNTGITGERKDLRKNNP